MDCETIDLGLVSYKKAYVFQKLKLLEVKENKSKDVIISCEHYPVITKGRSGSEDNILVSVDYLKNNNIEFYCVDRGGDVTMHSPGQLVIYPIFDLRRYKKDLKWFLGRLEEALHLTFKSFGIASRILENKRGAWVSDKKIASIGIGISGWVSFHGVSINVNNDLGYFSLIRPCGMDVAMCSMRQLVKGEISIPQVKEEFLKNISSVFNFKLLGGLVYDESYAS